MGGYFAHQKHKQICVPDNTDQEVIHYLACPSQTYDRIDCGKNVSYHIHGDSSYLGEGSSITLRNLYPRTTQDPGHVFLYNSNDCTGPHFDVRNGYNYGLGVDGQSLGSVWVNRSTLYSLMDNNINPNVYWGLTEQYNGICISANSWKENGIT